MKGSRGVLGLCDLETVWKPEAPGNAMRWARLGPRAEELRSGQGSGGASLRLRNVMAVGVRGVWFKGSRISCSHQEESGKQGQGQGLGRGRWRVQGAGARTGAGAGQACGRSGAGWDSRGRDGRGSGEAHGSPRGGPERGRQVPPRVLLGPLAAGRPPGDGDSSAGVGSGSDPQLLSPPPRPPASLSLGSAQRSRAPAGLWVQDPGQAGGGLQGQGHGHQRVCPSSQTGATGPGLHRPAQGPSVRGGGPGWPQRHRDPLIGSESRRQLGGGNWALESPSSRRKGHRRSPGSLLLRSVWVGTAVSLGVAGHAEKPVLPRGRLRLSERLPGRR